MEWVAEWTGFRPDTTPPIAAGEEIIKWWKEKCDPREKLLVFSDAMDVGSIEETYGISPAASASVSAGHQPYDFVGNRA